MVTPEYQKKAVAKYDAANTVPVRMKLNKKTDADILAKLDEVSALPGGKQGYIKALIRADITK